MTGFTMVVGLILAAAVAVAVQAGVVMLALGAAHSADPRVPAFGFLATLWLTVAADVLAARGSVTTR